MPRVAVIAVHGVADQQPGETNRAITKLLANIDEPGAGAAYGTFQTTNLHIPVRALPVPDRERHATQTFEEYAAQVHRASSGHAIAAALPADLAFTASLLARYEPQGPDETYETSVISSRRRASSSAEARDVDVYEMYWADLSRLTQSWWRMFAEVYQLLFHLASLGVHAVSAAVASEPGVSTPGRWRVWAVLQRGTANLLARDTLLLNLYLAGLVVVLLAARPSEANAPWLVAVGGALGIAVASGLWCYRHPDLSQSTQVAVGLTLLGAVAMAAVGVWLRGRPDTARACLATLLVIVVGLAIAYVTSRYERRRPGVKRRALVYGGPLVALVLFEIWNGHHSSAGGSWLPGSLLHTAEVVFFALRVLWIVLLLSMAATFVVGWQVVREASGEARARLDRVKWTARLTLALPSLVFLLLTTVLWAGAGRAILRWTAADSPHEALAVTAYVVAPAPAGHTVREVVDALILNATGSGVGLLMGLVGLAVFLVIYAVAPSVIAEVRPPRTPRDGARGGAWLDAGFGVARQAGRLLVLGVLVVLPVPFFLDRYLPFPHPAWWTAFTVSSTAVLFGLGAALGVGGAGLVVFGRRLKAITLGFRGVVDVLLDVDNYLREHPRDRAPRAQILTRMAALLRHVYAGGYDSVVVVAHSQGAVITADLLRFLAVGKVDQSDPGLARPVGMPLRLFTMGSPLRQLYGLRFPHLYAWARHGLDCAQPHDCAVLEPTTSPAPSALGVTSWVNAYRSGDYVGRYLWRRDRCPTRYATPAVDLPSSWPAGSFPAEISADPSSSRREFCIGAGAHTHYWDRTAPQIALELDALIQR